MPPRLTASDFDQNLLILFDAYVHGDLDRRGFLNQAQKYAKAGVTAAGLLAALSPNFAAGQVVRMDDPRLKIERTKKREPAVPRSSPPAALLKPTPVISIDVVPQLQSVFMSPPMMNLPAIAVSAMSP